MTAARIVWRRLDVPGHDACRLQPAAGGWTLAGVAVFSQGGVPARLDYRVDCDAAWRTRGGRVDGWMGGTAIAVEVARTPAGVWTLNGRSVDGLQDCLDLDLGFTPATNLLQLRRTALKEGEAAAVPVAWVDVPAGALQRVDQRYERRSAATYWYESPRFDYAALLEVRADTFIRLYPALWEAEE